MSKKKQKYTSNIETIEDAIAFFRRCIDALETYHNKKGVNKMKTIKQWKESKKNLGDFLNNGDRVCLNIAMEMLEVVPPIYMSENTFQVGEAESFVNNKPVYMTFSQDKTSWIFKGYMHEIKEAA